MRMKARQIEEYIDKSMDDIATSMNDTMPINLTEFWSRESAKRYANWYDRGLLSRDEDNDVQVVPKRMPKSRSFINWLKKLIPKVR